MGEHLLGSLAVLLVAGGTLIAAALGLRRARTTGDFYVASRLVSPRWNAAAISGEYLSAASYLGIAGLILAFGADMLWYPVGYTAGYLILLAVVSAPLRRSGAYTLPDFAEIRLGRGPIRIVSSVLVVVIGVLYLVPQLQGAGLTLATQTGAPRWLGGLVVCAVVLVVAAIGGMRSITFAQGVQFWLKFLALLLPALVLLGVWHRHDDHLAPGHPRAVAAATVTLDRDTTVEVPAAQTLRIDGTVDGRAVHGPVPLAAGSHRIGEGSAVTLEPGDVVPVAAPLPSQSNENWLRPLGSGQPHPLYASLSLILAICLGTMGLPHVLVRFYTNPDGRDARRTTVVVIAMLSAFYLLPTVFAVFGRRFLPELLLGGDTDATVLRLPERMLPGLPGQLLGALVTAGAFAAFLSTASGLTVSVAGVLSQDVLGRIRPGRRGSRVRRSGRIRAFRLAVAVAIVVPYLLSLAGQRLGLAAVVALAFAVAAATFCPLLVLGVWWRGLTAPGALAGLAVGGSTATAAVVATLAGADPGGWAGALLAQPAAWAVPLATAVMVAVSLSTCGAVPRDIGRIMIRLHAPESLRSELADLDRSSR
ncbi:cation acetate symporter [Rhodococcus sp. D2-41]|uniref:sodium/solute symporter n=1 Tax=Speluncibacter jeojiensis TaxID=2710754 RepID=UPI0024107B54|nr:cation acetate symporter [Rhodococcus sp. D2-41]MDG3009133.1 cation acetate symporter [Rhodococcus sp. D2-41]